MFSKDKDSNPAAGQNRRRLNGPVSLISPDLCVNGNLSSPGDLQIDGTVEGDIQCQSLTIGASAKVTGRIIALEVLIRGALLGNIEAQTVTLAKTARVTGDILHDCIAIEAGAMLDGRLNGRNRAQAAAEPVASAESMRTEATDRIQMIRRQIK